MFSLDVVRWRDKKAELNAPSSQQQEQRTGTASEARGLRARAKAAATTVQTSDVGRRDEGDDGTYDTTLPRVAPQDAERDRKMKHLYGRTKKEMHDAYVERVSQWMQNAPAQKWTRDYAKQTSHRTEYVPRERNKQQEIGSPMLTTGPYSPRAVYKGGGECLRVLESPAKASQTGSPVVRDAYRPAIRFIEKSREREKEIHPPMSIPKNKTLECAHYFVEDVISADPEPPERRPTTMHHLKRATSRKHLLSPLKAAQAAYSSSSNQGTTSDGVDHRHYDPPPTTAEYVASPQWRTHQPGKWAGGVFVSTAATSSQHTAQSRSITGGPYSPTVRIGETFVPPHRRHPPSSKDAALNPRDHERRAQTAAAALRESRSPRRAEKKYFSSMWTQPGSPSAAPHPMTEATAESPLRSPVNGGRTLVLQLRDQTAQRQCQRELKVKRTSATSRSSPLRSHTAHGMSHAS